MPAPHCLRIALACAAWLLASGALAQSEAENRAAARELGREGIRLAESGQCAGAVDRLSRAEQLYHAPSILARLGECQVELGQLVEGTENLNRVVREELSEDAPRAFREAQKRAAAVLDRTLPRIPKLTVRVIAPEGVDYDVRVDGRVLPDVLVGIERPIDPGAHAVEVVAPGCQPASTRLTLAEGARETVHLALTVDPSTLSAATPGPGTSPLAPSVGVDPSGTAPVTEPAAPARVTPAAPKAAPAPAPAPIPDRGVRAGSSKTLGFVSIGVGVIGLAAGSVFGVTATEKKAKLDDVCRDRLCPDSSESDIDAMNSAATLSTVGFAVGAVGLGLGTVLLVTAPRQKPAARRVETWFGPGSAGVRGRF